MTLLAIMLFYHMTSCLCSALVLALVGWMSSVLRSRQQNIGISLFTHWGIQPHV